MIERFYCPGSPIDGMASLEGDEARHLIRVRRVEVGAEVELFDGRGAAFRAKVVELGRDRASLEILGVVGNGRGLGMPLTLATAVPKGERFDWLVEKATELGVSRLIPIIAARSSVDPRTSKLDRLRRVIVEASKQCRRDLLMDLDPPTPWTAMVGRDTSSTRLIAHPGGPALLTPGLIRATRPVVVAIGPEGGFDDDEMGRALEAGWLAVGLGETILRVETAAIAACSTVMAIFDARRSKEEN